MPKLSEPAAASEVAIWERVIHPTGSMSREGRSELWNSNLRPMSNNGCTNSRSETEQALWLQVKKRNSTTSVALEPRYPF